MEDYQKRVLVEQKELAKKIVALCIFITDFDKVKSLNDNEFNLLRTQLDRMLDYERILQMRLFQIDSD